MNESKTALKQAARPFIKWVGGKRQLLPQIIGNLPEEFDNIRTVVEPFVGGGAVFFALRQQYPDKRYVINDANRKLVTAYRVVRDYADALLERLSILQATYNGLSNETERQQEFQKQRERFNRADLGTVETAALFIFLNRTCFNGLYRENSSGRFNSPFGKYLRPPIYDPENIQLVNAALQGVEISCGDYRATIDHAGPDAFYYFDPPYRPISDTASFTSYTRTGFADRQQAELAGFCRNLSAQGTHWMMSNSDGMNRTPPDPFFDTLYSDCNIRRIAAPRNISRTGKKNHRIINHELLILK